MKGTVKEVTVYYYSDQTAETRILLKDNPEEIWFSAVAPVAANDKVEGTGKQSSLFDHLKQSHAKSIVDEIERISPNIRTDTLVFSAKDISDENTNASTLLGNCI